MKDNSQNLGYWVKRFSILANEAIDTALRPYGIGRSQWFLLSHLHADEGVPQRKLQEVLQVESATLTNLIAPLVKKGLVQQSVDPFNKRSKVVSLTAAGRALKLDISDPIEATRDRAFHSIDGNDLATAREVLKAAVHNLEK